MRRPRPRTVTFMARNSRTIGIADLGDALRRELTIFHEGLVERLDAAGEKAIKRMVKRTKTTAPELTGSFRRNITYKKVTADWKEPSKFVWCVRAPDYRITHLLVNGHANVDGSRTEGDDFLQNAKDEVLPEYERECEEAISE